MSTPVNFQKRLQARLAEQAGLDRAKAMLPVIAEAMKKMKEMGAPPDQVARMFRHAAEEIEKGQ